MGKVGTPRPGNGGSRPGSGRPRKTPLEPEMPPRPKHESARDFVLWALNAPDGDVGMDHKVRLALGALAADAKPAAPSKPAQPAEPPATGVYAARRVRGFGVVDGAKR